MIIDENSMQWDAAEYSRLRRLENPTEEDLKEAIRRANYRLSSYERMTPEEREEEGKRQEYEQVMRDFGAGLW